MTLESNNPYRAAGTFSGLSYTERQADRDLRRSIEENSRYPYVLAARQSGKSSLISHVRGSLDQPDFRTVFVDFSIFEPKEVRDEDAFRARFFDDCRRSLGLPTPLPAFERFMDGIEQLLFRFPDCRLIIFLDEVDALLHCPFKDTFFSILRNVFNERSNKRHPNLKRIQFVLAGAARPEELITDRLRSPFNVGEAIVLHELSLEETARTCVLLAKRAAVPLDPLAGAVFEQAGGSVYLTQLILERLWERVTKKETTSLPLSELESEVRKIASGIVTGAHDNIHFQNIRESLRGSEEAKSIYHRLLSGRSATSAERELVWFTGLSTREGPELYRNRIYQEVFGAHGPIDLEKPWRHRRMVKFTGSSSLAAAVILLLFFIWPWYQENRLIEFLASRDFAWNGVTRTLIADDRSIDTARLDEIAPALHRLNPRELDLSRSKQLTNVDGLKGLTSLQSLDLSGCAALQNVNGLRDVTSLRSLSLSYCNALKNVGGLKNLTALRTLKLDHCDALQEVEGLSRLTALESLDLRDCGALTNVNLLKNLTELKSLDLGSCRALQNVDVLKRLTALQGLDLSYRDALQDLDILKDLKSLQTLRLSHCRALTNVEGLRGLTALRWLFLSSCEKLQKVDALETLTALEWLALSGCRELTSVDALKRLTKLEHLELNGCSALKNVDALKGLTALQILDLEGCDAVPKESWPSLIAALPNTIITLPDGTNPIR